MEKLTQEDIKILLESLSNNDDDINHILLQETKINHEIKRALALASQSLKNSRTCLRGFVDNVIPTYTEEEFLEHFRIKKSLYKNLSKRYEASNEYPKLQTRRLCSARKCTAMFLWFSGHPCTYRAVAKRFDLALSSVSRIIERYTIFLSNLSPGVIKWPDEEQMIQSSKFFAKKRSFSKAIGCIDSEKFVFDPASDNRAEFIDCNGEPSICVQVVCNDQKKFMDVHIDCPGSSTENLVFHNSEVSEKLANCGDYYILGDSTYPCSKNLVTPYKDNGHLTSEQTKFNKKLNSCLATADNAFKMLTQRFPQLYYCKLKGLSKIRLFIRACCVLHNLANEDDLEFSFDINESSESKNTQIEAVDNARGKAMRDQICQEMHLKK